MDAEAHERALTALFMELKSGMRNVDREADPETALRSLKDLGGKMTECKRCVTALLVSVLSLRPLHPPVVAYRTAPPSPCAVFVLQPYSGV
jgi:hypothetical protein